MKKWGEGDWLEDLLIQIVSQLGYPIFLQGSLAKDEPYPDHFFTFWNGDSEGVTHYDNDEKAILYDYDLNFYSCDAAKPYEALREAKKLLKQAGFIVSGDGFSVMSDEPTHDGRGINVQYIKY